MDKLFEVFHKKNSTRYVIVAVNVIPGAINPGLCQFLGYNVKSGKWEWLDAKEVDLIV